MAKTRAPRPWKIRWDLLPVVFVLVLVFMLPIGVVISIVMFQDRFANYRKRITFIEQFCNETTALIVAQDRVSEEINDSFSAEFSKSRVKKLAFCRYLISGTVRYQPDKEYVIKNFTVDLDGNAGRFETKKMEISP